MPGAPLVIVSAYTMSIEEAKAREVVAAAAAEVQRVHGSLLRVVRFVGMGTPVYAGEGVSQCWLGAQNTHWSGTLC
jgi:hypothetical protein